MQQGRPWLAMHLVRKERKGKGDSLEERMPTPKMSLLRSPTLLHGVWGVRCWLEWWLSAALPETWVRFPPPRWWLTITPLQMPSSKEPDFLRQAHGPHTNIQAKYS